MSRGILDRVASKNRGWRCAFRRKVDRRPLFWEISSPFGQVTRQEGIYDKINEIKSIKHFYWQHGADEQPKLRQRNSWCFFPPTGFSCARGKNEPACMSAYGVATRETSSPRSDPFPGPIWLPQSTARWPSEPPKARRRSSSGWICRRSR